MLCIFKQLVKFIMHSYKMMPNYLIHHHLNWVIAPRCIQSLDNLSIFGCLSLYAFAKFLITSYPLILLKDPKFVLLKRYSFFWIHICICLLLHLWLLLNVVGKMMATLLFFFVWTIWFFTDCFFRIDSTQLLHFKWDFYFCWCMNLVRAADD